VGDVRIAATLAERRAIYRLRYDVYIEEQGKPYPVPAANRELCDETDDACTHFYIGNGTDVVAASRSYFGPLTPYLERAFGSAEQALSREQFHFVSRLCVTPAARHTLASWRLAKAAFIHGRALGVEISFLHCAVRLATLYGRLGYQPYRSPFEDVIAGTQLPLRLFAADERWLREHLSPFLPLAAACRQRGPCLEAAMSSTFHPDVLGDDHTSGVLFGGR
jgi:predicted GNAT family N-acyltransferase